MKVLFGASLAVLGPLGLTESFGTLLCIGALSDYLVWGLRKTIQPQSRDHTQKVTTLQTLGTLAGWGGILCSLSAVGLKRTLCKEFHVCEIAVGLSLVSDPSS